MLSCVWLFAAPWTGCSACEISRQEYWNRLSFPIPGNLSVSGIETSSFVSPALADGVFTTLPPEESKKSLHLVSSGQLLSRVQLFATPWTVAHQTPLSMGFSTPFEWITMPSSRASSQLGIQPRSPTVQADSLPFESPGKPGNQIRGHDFPEPNSGVSIQASLYQTQITFYHHHCHPSLPELFSKYCLSSGCQSLCDLHVCSFGLESLLLTAIFQLSPK